MIIIALLLLLFGISAQSSVCPVPEQFATASRSDNNMIVFNDAVLDKMTLFYEKKGETAVQVISFVGVARKGKSTTLNMLAEHLLKPDVWKSCDSEFGISFAGRSFTRGLWLWAFSSDMTNSRKAVVLIDSQGLNDFDNVLESQEGVDRLMGLAMMIPDLCVYYAAKTINTASIETLSLGAKFADWLEGDASDMRMARLVTVLNTDNQWTGLGKTHLVESREDRDEFLHLVNSSPRLQRIVQKFYPDATMLVLPDSDSLSDEVLDYRASPVGNKLLRAQLDTIAPDYVRHRGIVFETLLNKLNEASGRPRFLSTPRKCEGDGSADKERCIVDSSPAAALSVCEPSMLRHWWVTVASGLNKQSIASGDMLSSLMDHKLQMLERAAVKNVENNYNAVQQKTVFPLTEQQLQRIVLCDSCTKAMEVLEMDSKIKSAAVKRVLERLAELQTKIKQTNDKAVSLLVEKATAATRANVRDVFSSQQRELTATAMELDTFLITHALSLFRGVASHARDLNFQRTWTAMSQCDGCLTPLATTKPFVPLASFASSEGEIKSLVAVKRQQLWDASDRYRASCVSSVKPYSTDAVRVCEILVNMR